MIPFSPLRPFEGMGPITDITPFTKRAGETYHTILEKLAAYLDYIAESITGLDEKIVTEVNKQLEEMRVDVQAAIDAGQALTDEKLEQWETQAHEKLEQWETQAQELADYLQQKIDDAINGSFEINDQIMADIVKDDSSAASVELNAKYVKKSDAVTSVAGRTGAVVLKPVDVGGSESATSGTMPLRTTGGKLPGVGKPTAATDAANKQYVDDAVSPATAKAETAHTNSETALARANVQVSHENVLVGELDINIFTIKTGGKHYPGAVTRRLADGPNPSNQNSFITAKQQSARHGEFVSNGSAWDSAVGGRMRGANIIDGVAHGELSVSHPQDNAAVGYCSDGTLRYYEAAKGDTAVKMLSDGVIHSWSWGPAIVVNNAVHNYAASGGWATLNTTAKSARTILAQTMTGDIAIIQIYGVTGESGATVGDCANALAGRGYKLAVMLDGGGSTQSAWGGKIAHVSSDPESRPLSDFVIFNAPPSNSMTIQPRALRLTSPFYGNLHVALDDGTAYIYGNVDGNTAGTTDPKNARLCEPAPLWVRNGRARGMVRGGGGVLAMAKLSGSRAVHITAPQGGVNNPDVYIECDANFGMK